MAARHIRKRKGGINFFMPDLILYLGGGAPDPYLRRAMILKSSQGSDIAWPPIGERNDYARRGGPQRPPGKTDQFNEWDRMGLDEMGCNLIPGRRGPPGQK